MDGDICSRGPLYVAAKKNGDSLIWRIVGRWELPAALYLFEALPTAEDRTGTERRRRHSNTVTAYFSVALPPDDWRAGSIYTSDRAPDMSERAGGQRVVGCWRLEGAYGMIMEAYSRLSPCRV